MFTRLLQVAIAAIAVKCATAQNSINVTATDVEQAFTTAKIVPDVVPSFNPTGLLNVVFFDNTTNVTVSVTPGMNLTREQTALRPTVSLTSNMTTFAGQTFVLAMVDPDAPTPQNPTEAEIRHLLAPNITLNGTVAEGALLVNNTPAISDFLRPTPPAGSDPHRYTLLLFVQPSNFSTIVNAFVNASTSISNFNISAFAEQTGLGSPVAGNFFLTGPDANSTGAASGNTTNSTSTASDSTTSSTSPASPLSNTPSSALGVPELSWTGVALAVGALGMSMVV